MNTNQTGWFILQSSNPKFPDAVAYRCTACGIEYLFGDEKEPRAFCCGGWKTKPKESWFSKLPRVQAVPVRGLTVLHAPKIDFGDPADYSLES
jgi:hypothetical protein